MKIPIITLIFLIALFGGMFLISFQIQQSKTSDFLTNRGFIPSINTQQECLAKGFLWIDLGQGKGQCNNNLTIAECQSKGYYWNPCAFNTTKTEQTAEGFIHNQICVEKCIIK